jgi:hypothetical protein
MTADYETRIATLEAKIAELEALVSLALRLMAVEKPVSVLLRRFGATDAQDTAVHALLDDVASRAERGGLYAPSFNGFVSDLYRRFPAVRSNREFVALLIDALKLDRPAYQKLHDYVVAAQWPTA